MRAIAMVAAFLLFVVGAGGAGAAPGSGAAADVAGGAATLVLHTYEVRFRLDGRVSTTRVQASDAGHARKLVKAQYGDKVTVLGTKRVD